MTVLTKAAERPDRHERPSACSYPSARPTERASHAVARASASRRLARSCTSFQCVVAVFQRAHAEVGAEGEGEAEVDLDADLDLDLDADRDYDTSASG
jgi:hypothetical protein